MRELRSTAKDEQADDAIDAVFESLQAFELDDFELAAEQAEKAKSLASRSGQVRELLGLTYYHLERWQECSRELLTFKRLTNSVDENHVIADCYRALGRPERAKEMCNEVLRSQVTLETWAELCMVRAGAHADLGEFDEGLASLARVKLKSGSIEDLHLKLWYVESDLLEKAGKTQAARKLWEKIAEADPDFFDVAERLSAKPK
ncbi:MAG: tetratricopeptide repeat protein [Actinomycetota bacterium]